MDTHDSPKFLWKPTDHNPLRNGKTYGVDVSCMLYAIISCASVYRRLERKPPSSVEREVATWADEWYRVHLFEELEIKLVFCFDGLDKMLKRLRRVQRQRNKRRWERAKQEAQTWQEYDKAIANLRRVNGHMIRAFCDWVKANVSGLEFS